MKVDGDWSCQVPKKQHKKLYMRTEIVLLFVPQKKEWYEGEYIWGWMTWGWTIPSTKLSVQSRALFPCWNQHLQKLYQPLRQTPRGLYLMNENLNPVAHVFIDLCLGELCLMDTLGTLGHTHEEALNRICDHKSVSVYFSHEVQSSAATTTLSTWRLQSSRVTSLRAWIQLRGR